MLYDVTSANASDRPCSSCSWIAGTAAARWITPSVCGTRRPTSVFWPRSTRALGQLCGHATRAVMRRMHEVYGDERFERLAGISNGQFYNLRKSTTYRRRRTTFRKTRATAP